MTLYGCNCKLLSTVNLLCTAAIRGRFREASDKEIGQQISRRLARSADSEGGRKYRPPSKRRIHLADEDMNKDDLFYDSSSGVEH